MRKYLAIIRNTWTEMLTYRFNFVMWRARSLLQILTLYFFWLAMIPQGNVLFGYSQSAMLTYILGTSIVSSIVISSRTSQASDEINDGRIARSLLRPINYFALFFSKDVGDKAMHTLFSVFELIVLILILKPPLFLQSQPEILLFAFLSVTIAIISYFFFNLLISFVAFWTPETWAPRFIFTIVLGFFAGTLFPLDILPRALYNIFQYTPFPYLLYFPIKVYLGQLSLFQIYQGLLVSLFWVVALFFITDFVWKRGLKQYSAFGG